MGKKFKPAISSKRWKPPAEEELAKVWDEEEPCSFNPQADKIYSVDTPPPYLSGSAHIGQLIHYTQIDMIARFRRMQGWEVNFPLGIDRNGLPVELRVEKKHGLDMHTTPRSEFLQKCKELLDKDEVIMKNLFKRLGIGFNTYDEEGSYRTDSPEYRAITQATFIDLWKRSLVYSDYRPNNWCFECKTTIADAEVEYAERPTTLNYIYFDVEGMEPLQIATTRPELLCACGAVFIHPDDKRYAGYGGKKAKVPIFNLEVPIIESHTAQMEFGTGALMVCSYGDMADVMAFRDHALTPIAAISPEGTMTEAAGPYEGMKSEEAKKKIIEALKEQEVLFKQEQTIQRVPLCWRSKTPIEFIAMDEYYLNQVDFLDELMRIAQTADIYPESHRQILIDWINRVSVDWPISRRRYYGTEIPLWYCEACKEPVAPERGEIRYYQPWCEDPPFTRCPKCGAESNFTGEERTFDTWMDSSISGLQIIGFLQDDKLFKKAFGNVIRPQGKEIVRTWLYYSLLRTYQLTKKPAFKEIWISGLVMDEKGEKMSKSKGNSPDPMPIIDKYGADAMRLFGVLEAGLGSDIRFSEDRLAGTAKFMTKLWNIARFISMFPIPEKTEHTSLTEVDQWILAELNKVIGEIQSGCNKLDFHRPMIEVRGFTWNFFADHILEMLKGRCFNSDDAFSEDEQTSAWSTLHQALKVILKAMAPVIPFITDRIYRELYDKEGIHNQEYPLPRKGWNSPLTDYTELLLQTNSGFWKFKRENNLSLRQGLPEAWVAPELMPWAKDLQAMHGIEKLNFTKPEKKGIVEVSLSESDEVIFVLPPEPEE
ncbi:MAG: Valine--tRNA ligase [Candidatus Thorarchaeota archaeon]|nr:MAG: Valine--tRNA ligase [Candidatus Thorarchaeota archaeon]